MYTFKIFGHAGNWPIRIIAICGCDRTFVADIYEDKNNEIWYVGTQTGMQSEKLIDILKRMFGLPQNFTPEDYYI